MTSYNAWIVALEKRITELEAELKKSQHNKLVRLVIHDESKVVSDMCDLIWDNDDILRICHLDKVRTIVTITARAVEKTVEYCKIKNVTCEVL